MKKIHMLSAAAMALAMVTVLALPLSLAADGGGGQATTSSSVANVTQAASAGAVFTTTNCPIANSVVSYVRDLNGSLTSFGSFHTGGRGNGTFVDTQGAIRLSTDGRTLFVTNAISNDVSIFGVSGANLTLTGRVSSGGSMPVSITSHGSLVYVLNAGGNASIAGFMLSGGNLTAIPGSIRPLSGAANSAPRDIGISPDGRILVVTEQNANVINTYVLDSTGAASAPTAHKSVGNGPFGLTFDAQGHLLVTDATSGALTSYAVSATGNLSVISGPVPDGATGTCWIAITPNGSAFVANTPTGTISSYSVAPSGVVTLINAQAAKVKAPAVDLALTKDGQFLYNHNDDQISRFSVGQNGSLTQVSTINSVSNATTGLAAA